MRIGEKMSEITDLDRICRHNNDLYENYESILINKPLDTGRLLYAKLRFAIDEDIQIEVWWNHFSNEITAIVLTAPWEMTMTIVDPVMARSELLAYVDSIVADLQERICQQ